MNINIETIKSFFSTIWQNEDVRELRIIEQSGKIFYGYFNSIEKIVTFFSNNSRWTSLCNCYTTLNPCKSALLARCYNKTKAAWKKDKTTGDKDIKSLDYIFIDIDPERVAGVSASNEEVESVTKIAEKLKSKLGKYFFLNVFSGNGQHFLARLGNLPNEKNNVANIKNYLNILATQYSNSKVKVDISVFNPSRILKIAGTIGRKGENIENIPGIEDRPHRLSYIISTQRKTPILELPELPIIEKKATTYIYSSSKKQFNVRNFLSQHGIAIKEELQDGNRKKLILSECVFDGSHKDKDAAIFVEADGKLGYKCFHDSCSNRTWTDVRELFEPGYKEKRAYREAKQNFSIKAKLEEIESEITKIQLFKELESLINNCCYNNIRKEEVRAFLETEIKAKFKLNARDIENYRSLITSIYKKQKENKDNNKKKAKKEAKILHLNTLKISDNKAYLQETIRDIRRDKFLKSFEIKEQISEIIIENLKLRGLFYKTQNNQLFFFNSENKELLDIESYQFSRFLTHIYGINDSENEFLYFLAELKTYISYNGSLTKIYSFSYYNKKKNCLYIDKNNNQIVKITSDSIETIDNGQDNVLFQSNDFEAFEIDAEQEKFNLIDELLIDNINFVKAKNIVLSEIEQRLYLKVWLHCLFFEEIQKDKPILLILGNKESGKTTVLKKLLWFLQGESSQVQAMPRKEEDFLSSLCSNYLNFFDNVDSYKDWLQDNLATAATGQKIEKRKLYTTNEIVKYNPRGWLALTSREPKFKRDDVISRLILLRTEKIENFKSQNSFETQIIKCRNQLWTELSYNLQAVLKELGKKQDKIKIVNRMADFFLCGYAVAKTWGQEEVWVIANTKMKQDKNDFLLLDNPVCMLIGDMLEEQYVLENLTSTALFSAIEKYSSEKNIKLSFRNPARLGMFLVANLHGLQNFFFIEKTQKRNKTIWNIRLSKKKESEFIPN